MIVRINPDLKTRVNNLAKSEGKNVSEIVRELLEGYVRDRDIGSYIDDLWGRVGKKLSSRGLSSIDIERTIRETRDQK
jgi:predicted DNA-binding protein